MKCKKLRERERKEGYDMTFYASFFFLGGDDLDTVMRHQTQQLFLGLTTMLTSSFTCKYIYINDE